MKLAEVTIRFSVNGSFVREEKVKRKLLVDSAGVTFIHGYGSGDFDYKKRCDVRTENGRYVADYDLLVFGTVSAFDFFK